MARAAKKPKQRRATSTARQASVRRGLPTRGPGRAAAGSPAPARSDQQKKRSRPAIHRDILAYNAAQSAGDQRICDALAGAIHRNLPGAEGRIWHAHPVWFLDGNPIVGYHRLKDCIRLLFWSGRSFDEPGLAPEGGFQTAGARYTAEDQISAKDLRRWLGKSVKIQWDYKNIVKRRGRLERLR
jgi:hypothetical protein